MRIIRIILTIAFILTIFTSCGIYDCGYLYSDYGYGFKPYYGYYPRTGYYLHRSYFMPDRPPVNHPQAEDLWACKSPG